MGIITKFLKALIKRVVATSLVWRILTGKRWRDQLVVLMYHKVVADTPDAHELTIRHFRHQLDWLTKNFDVLTPEQFVSLDRNRKLTGKPKVLLTFDDAFISIQEHVYAELKKRGLRGLVFVPSEPVIENDTIWPQLNSDLFMCGEYEQLPAFDGSDRELAPRNMQERIAAEKEVRQRLKKMPNTERRAAMDKLKAAANWTSDQLQHDSRIMSWSELRACADVFSYGGHTHTHPIMSSQSRQAQRDDVQTCVEHLHNELGVAPLMFAYPNGEPGDYNEDSIAVLREAGYQWAFTTEEGIYRLGDDPMTIRRLPTWAPEPGDLAWLIYTAA